LGEAAKLPFSLFTTGHLRPRDQFDAWHESISVIFDVAPPAEHHPDSGFAATVRGWHLGDYLHSLVARADSMTMAEAPLVAQATTDMIVACFQSTAETTERARAAIDQTMRQRIQRHITAHLESPALHTEALRAAFRISRSQLYRLFEPLGGVAHYIQEQRLTRACAELCNPVHDRRIYEIAFALGFSSEAHFSRVFRSTFGLSPSDVRARAQATRVNASRPTSAADPNGGYEDWVRELSKS
jgi:AraC-like DNA-binding protein